MLLEFSFSNYKSYRERATLGLYASREKRHGFHVVETGNERLLPCATIFGANAGGKTNVYDAFVFMKTYVLNSFSYGAGNFIPRASRLPFFGNEKEPSEFEVFFIDDSDEKERVWQYGFIVDDTKVIAEWLCVRSKKSKKFRPVFTREDGVITWDSETKQSLERSLAPKALIASLGNVMREPDCQRVVNWFAGSRTISFGTPVENLLRSTIFPSGFDSDTNVQASLARFLSTFDPSIKDFRVEKLQTPDEPDSFSLRIDTIHKIAGQDRFLPFVFESGGTQKMATLYSYISGALKNGGVLFIDELNARLHPLLHLNIIISFLNQEINTKHAQLIITTHDAALLEFDVLRNDEIWVAEKNLEEESSLYSFASFVDIKQMRGKNGRTLMKNYLYGKLGGTPVLESINFEIKDEQN